MLQVQNRYSVPLGCRAGEGLLQSRGAPATGWKGPFGLGALCSVEPLPAAVADAVDEVVSLQSLGAPDLSPVPI